MNDEFDVQSKVEAPMGPLTALLTEAANLEVAVEDLEAQLKAAKASLHALTTTRIPEMMLNQMQMLETSFMVGNRQWKVEIKDFVAGGLPKEDEGKRAAAIQWLEKHEGGDLIKTEITISFNREEHTKAKQLAERLRKAGYTPELESSVHASTLKSFAMERLRSGAEIDAETLGLHVGKLAKFKLVNIDGKGGRR
jgi:hypothetical protein